MIWIIRKDFISRVIYDPCLNSNVNLISASILYLNMTCWAPLTSHHICLQKLNFWHVLDLPTGGIALLSVSLNAEVMESWVSLFWFRDLASLSILGWNVDLNINVTVENGIKLVQTPRVNTGFGVFKYPSFTVTNFCPES